MEHVDCSSAACPAAPCTTRRVFGGFHLRQLGLPTSTLPFVWRRRRRYCAPGSSARRGLHRHEHNTVRRVVGAELLDHRHDCACGIAPASPPRLLSGRCVAAGTPPALQMRGRCLCDLSRRSARGASTHRTPVLHLHRSNLRSITNDSRSHDDPGQRSKSSRSSACRHPTAAASCDTASRELLLSSTSSRAPSFKSPAQTLRVTALLVVHRPSVHSVHCRCSGPGRCLRWHFNLELDQL